MATFTEESAGFVCREVLIELVWVLERAYALQRADIARALDGLLEARELVIEVPDRVAVALDRYRRGGPGFADQMIALSSASMRRPSRIADLRPAKRHVIYGQPCDHIFGVRRHQRSRQSGCLGSRPIDLRRLT